MPDSGFQPAVENKQGPAFYSHHIFIPTRTSVVIRQPGLPLLGGRSIVPNLVAHDSRITTYVCKRKVSTAVVVEVEDSSIRRRAAYSVRAHDESRQFPDLSVRHDIHEKSRQQG
ncbi:unnamed protein product [Ectocarpus sp. 12 AP-2014]